MKFAYQAGLAIGQHKTAFAVLLVGVIGAGYYLLSIPSPVVAASASPSAAVFDPSQTPGAIARAQAEASQGEQDDARKLI